MQKIFALTCCISLMVSCSDPNFGGNKRHKSAAAEDNQPSKVTTSDLVVAAPVTDAPVAEDPVAEDSATGSGSGSISVEPDSNSSSEQSPAPDSQQQVTASNSAGMTGDGSAEAKAEQKGSAANASPTVCGAGCVMICGKRVQFRNHSGNDTGEIPSIVGAKANVDLVSPAFRTAFVSVDADASCKISVTVRSGFPFMCHVHSGATCRPVKPANPLQFEQNCYSPIYYSLRVAVSYEIVT
jgi:hypothetical protein